MNTCSRDLRSAGANKQQGTSTTISSSTTMQAMHPDSNEEAEQEEEWGRELQSLLYVGEVREEMACRVQVGGAIQCLTTKHVVEACRRALGANVGMQHESALGR